jgi:hypothetical protein
MPVAPKWLFKALGDAMKRPTWAIEKPFFFALMRLTRLAGLWPDGRYVKRR